MASATLCETKWEKRFEFSCDAEFDNNNRAKTIGLDKHMQISSVINWFSYQGATMNYLKDKPESEEVTCTMIFRAQTNEETLDLVSLINQQVPYIEDSRRILDFETLKRDPIQVVTSVVYGAEVYCVLAHAFNDFETDHEARQKIKEKLPKLATKWLDALNEMQDLAEFKKRFDMEERRLITRIKCRLYADLQTEPVLHCDFFAAYVRSLELMINISHFPKEDARSSKPIPIAIQLCPVEVLVNPTWGFHNTVKYRDLDEVLTERCCTIFAELDRVIVRTNKILSSKLNSAISDDLKTFRYEIIRYKSYILLENVPGKVRNHLSGDDVEEVVETVEEAENHLLFKPRHLEQWLNFKLAELEMMESMNSRTGIGIQLVTSQVELGEQPVPVPQKKYSVLLYVPPLDDLTQAFLLAMEDCVETYNVLEEAKFLYCKQPWHTIHWKRITVLDKIDELARYVDRNKDILNNVNFVVCQTKNRNVLQCNYYVFDNDQQASYQLHRLPDPPTGLRVYLQDNRNSKRAKNSSVSIRVEWDYEELGIPCTFILQSRLKGSLDSWNQQRTVAQGQTHLNIHFEIGSALEVQVAAETSIGFSEFSQIVDTESAIFDEDDDVQENQLLISPPRKKPNICLQPQTDVKVKAVTRNSAELEWMFLPEFGNCFRVDYWRKGDGFNRICKFCDESPCLLENLEVGTTYLATVSTGDGSNWSPPSNNVMFTTIKDCRFAESLVTHSEKIRHEDGKDVYAVPIEPRDLFVTTSKKFVFGEADKRVGQNHRTVLLIGSCGSGKTSFINSMINYLFDVDLDDPFLFQLIDPHEEDSQNVTVYEINFANGFRVDYSLTIINTPNYAEEDAEKNMQITELIRDFFDDDVTGIQQVDMVGFVVNSSECELESVDLYIYCSLISIFGNGIKENVNFIYYAEEEDPPLLSAIAEDGFVIRESFCHKFEIGIDNQDKLNKFFSSFALTSTKSSSVSKQALDAMKRLEATMLGLQYRTDFEMAKFEELQKAMEIFNHFNNKKTFEVSASVVKRRILPLGKYATNCINCKSTCRPVSGAVDVPLADESGVCSVCPGGCPWKEHVNQTFKWEYVQEKQLSSSGAISKKYEAELMKTLTEREVATAMDSEVVVRKKDLVRLIHTVLLCSIQLNEVARILNEKWKTHCIKVRVKVSKKIIPVLEQLKGFEDLYRRQPNSINRIEALKKLQKAAQFSATRKLLLDDSKFWNILDGLDLQFFTPRTGGEEEVQNDGIESNDGIDDGIDEDAN